MASGFEVWNSLRCSVLRREPGGLVLPAGVRTWGYSFGFQLVRACRWLGGVSGPGLLA